MNIDIKSTGYNAESSQKFGKSPKNQDHNCFESIRALRPKDSFDEIYNFEQKLGILDSLKLDPRFSDYISGNSIFHQSRENFRLSKTPSLGSKEQGIQLDKIHDLKIERLEGLEIQSFGSQNIGKIEIDLSSIRNKIEREISTFSQINIAKFESNLDKKVRDFGSKLQSNEVMLSSLRYVLQKYPKENKNSESYKNTIYQLEEEIQNKKQKEEDLEIEIEREKTDKRILRLRLEKEIISKNDRIEELNRRLEKVQERNQKEVSHLKMKFKESLEQVQGNIVRQYEDSISEKQKESLGVVQDLEIENKDLQEQITLLEIERVELRTQLGAIQSRISGLEREKLEREDKESKQRFKDRRNLVKNSKGVQSLEPKEIIKNDQSIQTEKIEPKVVELKISQDAYQQTTCASSSNFTSVTLSNISNQSNASTSTVQPLLINKSTLIEDKTSKISIEQLTSSLEVLNDDYSFIYDYYSRIPLKLKEITSQRKSTSLIIFEKLQDQESYVIKNVNRLESRFHKLQTLLVSLSSKLNQQKSINQKNLKSKKIKIQKLELELKEKDEKISNLESKITSEISSIDGIHKSEARKQSQIIKKLESEISENKFNCDSLLLSIQDFLNNIVKKTENPASYEVKISSIFDDDLEETFKAILERIVNQKNNFEKKIQNFEILNQEIMTKNDKDSSNLQSQIDSLHTKNQKLSKQSDSYTKQIKELENKIGESIKQKIEANKEDQEKSKNLNDEINYLNTQNNNLALKEDELSKTISSLENEIKYLKNKSKNEINTLTVEFNSEKSTIQSKLKDSEYKIKTLKAKIKDTENKFEDYKEQQSTLSKQTKDLTLQQLNSSRKQVSEFVKEMADANTKIALLRSELTSNEDNYSQVKDCLKKEVKIKENQISKIQGELNAIKESSSKLQKDRNQLEEELTKVTKQSKGYSQKIKNLEQNLESARESCVTNEKLATEYEQEIEENDEMAKELVKTLESEIEEMKNTTRVKEGEHSSEIKKLRNELENKCSELVEELRIAHQKILDLEAISLNKEIDPLKIKKISSGAEITSMKNISKNQVRTPEKNRYRSSSKKLAIDVEADDKDQKAHKRKNSSMSLKVGQLQSPSHSFKLDLSSALKNGKIYERRQADSVKNEDGDEKMIIEQLREEVSRLRSEAIQETSGRVKQSVVKDKNRELLAKEKSKTKKMQGKNNTPLYRQLNIYLYSSTTSNITIIFKVYKF